MYGCMASSFSILPCTLPRHYVSSASCTSTLCAAPYVQIMHSCHVLFYFSQVDLLLQHQFFMSHALLLALWLRIGLYLYRPRRHRHCHLLKLPALLYSQVDFTMPGCCRSWPWARLTFCSEGFSLNAATSPRIGSAGAAWIVLQVLQERTIRERDCPPRRSMMEDLIPGFIS